MPRRYDRYGFMTMGLEEAAKLVEQLLGMSLQERQSDYWGTYYFRGKAGDQNLMLYASRDDDRDRPYRVILDVNNIEDLDEIRSRLTTGRREPRFMETKLLPDEPDDEPELDDIERAVLRIVEQGRGAFGWHAIEVRLGMIELPRRDYNVLTVLQGLQTKGLVAEVPDGDRRTWRPVWSPDGGPDLDTLIDALRAGPAEMLARFRALIDDPAALDSALRQLVATRPDAGDAIAFGVVQLPEPLRTELAEELWTSSNVGLRQALYTMLAPARLEIQGRAWKALRDRDWRACTAAGLGDEDPTVRRFAAAMVFAAGDAGPYSHVLLGNLQRADRPERFNILLALGSAKDQASLHALQEAAAGPDVGLATAAIRALAARPDGHADALAPLLVPGSTLRGAAVFGLAQVMEGLTPEQLEQLEQVTAVDADIREALQHYRSRIR